MLISAMFNVRNHILDIFTDVIKTMHRILDAQLTLTKEEHTENKTNKIGRALKQYGYDNFKFEILETVKSSENQELYDVEYMYIIKYDSIKNGYNTRRNCKDELWFIIFFEILYRGGR